LIYSLTKQLDVTSSKSGYLGAQFVNFQATHSEKKGKISRIVGSRFFGLLMSASTLLLNWELLWKFYYQNKINFTEFQTSLFVCLFSEEGTTQIVFLGLLWHHIFKKWFTLLKKGNKTVEEVRPLLREVQESLVSCSDYPEELLLNANSQPMWMSSWSLELLTNSELMDWLQLGCRVASKFFQIELADILNPGPLAKGVGTSLPSNDKVESVFGRLTTVFRNGTANMHPQVISNVTAYQTNMPTSDELQEVLRECVCEGRKLRQATPTMMHLKRKRCEGDTLKLETLKQKRLKRDKKIQDQLDTVLVDCSQVPRLRLREVDKQLRALKTQGNLNVPKGWTSLRGKDKRDLLQRLLTVD